MQLFFFEKAIHPYVATQPDELSLEVADVVNVLRKMADGNVFWFYLINHIFFQTRVILTNDVGFLIIINPINKTNNFSVGLVVDFDGFGCV